MPERFHFNNVSAVIFFGAAASADAACAFFFFFFAHAVEADATGITIANAPNDTNDANAMRANAVIGSILPHGCRSRLLRLLTMRGARHTGFGPTYPYSDLHGAAARPRREVPDFAVSARARSALLDRAMAPLRRHRAGHRVRGRFDHNASPAASKVRVGARSDRERDRRSVDEDRAAGPRPRAARRIDQRGHEPRRPRSQSLGRVVFREDAALLRALRGGVREDGERREDGREARHRFDRPRRRDPLRHRLSLRAVQVKVKTLSFKALDEAALEKAIAALAPFVTPERQKRIDEVLATKTRELVLVLEDIYDEQNASAVLRTAESFGVLEVHAVERTCAFIVDRQISLGSQKWIELYKHKSTDAPYRALAERGYTIFASSIRGDAIDVDLVPIDRPLVLVFGNEHEGLSIEAQEAASGRFRV